MNTSLSIFLRLKPLDPFEWVLRSHSWRHEIMVNLIHAFGAKWHPLVEPPFEQCEQLSRQII